MPFKKHTLDLSIGELAYYQAGTGDPLLFLHGASGPRLSKPLAGLSRHRTLIIPVFPGWEKMRLEPDIRTLPGLAELIGEFAREAIGVRLDVAGYSFGGWVAAWLALLDPELVDRLILICPAGIQPDTRDRPKTPEEMQARLYAHPENLRAEDMPKTTPGDTLNAIAHYTADLPSFDSALVERLPDIRSTTLVMCGSHDLIIPEETAALIEESVPRSGVISIDDAAHAIDVDQPEAVEAAMSGFLDDDENFLDTLD